MRKQGVVLKLFVVTSVLILIVFSIVMLAEGIFFERFYRSSKIHALERNMNHFAEQFKQADADKQRIPFQLGTFMNQNDASIAILNSHFERMVIAPYYLLLQVDGKTVTVQLPTEGMTVEDIPHGIQAGDHLVVDGIFMDEADTIMHPVRISRESSELGEGLVRIEGRVTDYILPEKRSYNPIYQDGLIDDALREWQSAEAEASNLALLHKNGFVQAEWRDSWSGVQYVVLLKSLSEDGSRYLFVMASLQPVGEAVAILKQYFIYLAPIILLLAVLLSFIYSRIVSRPLVSLSRSAARLAQLDFTVQPEIHSKDEFGELSRHMVELSRNLDKALKELTQANLQLQADVEEKQRSEQLRKELVANISHELKTPLGIVKGFAEGLQDGVAGDKKDRYLALIVNETDRMNALIMDMLELSKYEVKAVRLQPRNFSLGVLIKGAAESFSGQLESKQLQIRIDAEEALMVTADPVRIEQVVMNLLSNAVRHATENSVITVTIERSAAGEINTVIANAGSPIAEEDLERIWEQFYRTERSRDRKSGGTGLGLAIVKHIMELHASQFGVRNTEEGVAFYFTLQESRGEHRE
ncbi:sensor histidine kinase [Paenibacillus gorillae]|uniref:sensor histidine kinase n=1 Tax=Paenibacillus gorillae TaxID=1243662 RepID=UPI0004B6C28C|nr:sensor histidine kinase [Paenibacillus gorillae]